MKNTTREDRLQSLLGECNGMKGDLDHARKELLNALGRVSQQNAVLQSDLAAAHNEIKALRAQIKDIPVQYAAVMRQHNQMQKMLADAREGMDELNGDLSELLENLEKARRLAKGSGGYVTIDRANGKVRVHIVPEGLSGGADSGHSPPGLWPSFPLGEREHGFLLRPQRSTH